MIRESLVKKGLTIAVILLFIGVAFAPSITADLPKTSKDSELVDITIGIYTAEGIRNHTVQLSRDDTLELEKLIDNIENRLDNATTREETVEIFNDAVVSFNEFGLLGDINVEEAQKLVTGGDEYKKLIQYLDGLDCEINDEDYLNLFCLVALWAKRPSEENILWDIVYILFMLCFVFRAFPTLLGIFAVLLVVFGIPAIFNPFRFMNNIIIQDDGMARFFFSIGLLGIFCNKNKLNKIVGFTGIKLMLWEPFITDIYEAFYLGSAIAVE